MKGEVGVLKIPVEENPAELITKFLHIDVINNHLHKLNLRSVKGNEVKKVQDKKVRIVKGRWADEEDRDGDAEDLAEWWVSGLCAHGSK